MQLQQEFQSPATAFAVPASPRRRHAGWTIALHWASVLAVVTCTASALLREATEQDALRIALLDLHRQAGLFVLLALEARLALRLRHGLADVAGALPAALRAAATLAHVGLYALLFALPATGIALSQAHAVPVRLFGLLRLPTLVDADADLADRLSDFHLGSAWALLALVAAHVAAAAWHHWVRRDGVLTAMLPALRRRR